MNQISDIPQGSINPLANFQLYSFPTLTNTPYRIANGFGAKPLLTLNGFNVYHFGAANGWLDNDTTDILTGVTDFSFLIGYQRLNPIIGIECLFYCEHSSNNPYFKLLIFPSGALYLSLANGASSITFQSNLLNYADTNPHFAIVTIDQTNQEVTLTTDQESKSLLNPLYISGGSFSPSVPRNFRIGLEPALNYPLNDALLGDFLVYNGILSASEINDLKNYEKTRLGI